MKWILITGADSYIGTSFEKWIGQAKLSAMYRVDTVDMRGDAWKEKNFSSYDSVFHVAGIAHADVGRVTEEQKRLYYRVNCDLAVETAEKAKREGVKQFIYMSSIIVYGEVASIGEKRVITRETNPSPSNFYGDSKWKAEQKLQSLSAENFRVAILRPPMVYGAGCKGNYRILEKLVQIMPVFPGFHNERSVLSIKNLCRFIHKVIESEAGGTHLPQDPEYKSTSNLMREIAYRKGKKIWFTPLFNWMIYIMGKMPGRLGKCVNKAFGTLIYEK